MYNNLEVISTHAHMRAGSRAMLLRTLKLGLALLLLSAGARAGTDTDQLIVSATVQTGCALSGGTVDFGTYISGQPTDLDAVGQISYVGCFGDLTFEMDGGQSGNVAKRQMSSGSNRLGYQIYRDSSRTAVWGTGNDAYKVKLLAPQNGKIDLYARIPRGLTIQPGAYTDTINVTLTF